MLVYCSRRVLAEIGRQLGGETCPNGLGIQALTYIYRFSICLAILAAILVASVAGSPVVLGVLADAGSSYAAYRLAQHFNNQADVKDYNPASALHWYEVAAESGNLDALYEIGMLHFSAAVKNHSYKKAYDSFRQGAEAGHVGAAHNLAIFYEFGLGVEQDLFAAERWFQKTIALGNRETEHNLVLLYVNHPKDFQADKVEKAFMELRKQADAGDPSAVMTLALALIEGEWIEQNEEKGLALLHKATETIPDFAFLMIGDYYLNRNNGAPDYAKAMKYFEKSVESGGVVANYELGKMFEHGLGVERNYFKAARLYKASIEGKYFPGLISLGLLYCDGNGVERDYHEANRLFRRAKELDLPGGAASVGWMLINGFGVPENKEAGLRMIKEAADNEDYFGTYYFAKLLEEGVLVPQDHEQAVELYIVSAEKENQHAIAALKRLGIQQ
ncbi:tetratricopeptide repeat protein [Roseibium sp. Sym1]|uniref:tetratricopeptide repeat protein n=1 Tax=Roseibium sp. Sym1 TaxID=3016006 RepID=UPI0022B2C886|nr:tetratricopeptide repeat protein [Roseibium sp. Sym1]